jgi:hypothetical protein
MALIDTNLIIQAGALPTTFKGTPQQLLVEMVRRFKIVSPSGNSFFVISDVEPTSDVGPWLKGGTQWYVFSEVTKRYVPLDISASETHWYFIGNSTPGGVDPPLWLKTERDPTTTDASYGRALSWYEWTGSVWRPFVGVPASGNTASRPSNPAEYERYYDTDINVEIWFNRGKWRTVSGTPGDFKFVLFETLTEALQFNPGWALNGAANQALRGRVISQATADSGGGNPLSTGTDVPQRQAFETFFTTVTAGAVNVVPALALYALVKE